MGPLVLVFWQNFILCFTVVAPIHISTSVEKKFIFCGVPSALFICWYLGEPFFSRMRWNLRIVLILFSWMKSDVELFHILICIFVSSSDESVLIPDACSRIESLNLRYLIFWVLYVFWILLLTEEKLEKYFSQSFAVIKVFNKLNYLLLIFYISHAVGVSFINFCL